MRVRTWLLYSGVVSCVPIDEACHRLTCTGNNAAKRSVHVYSIIPGEIKNSLPENGVEGNAGRGHCKGQLPHHMQNAEKAITFDYIHNSEVDDKSTMSVRAAMMQLREGRQTGGNRGA